MNKYLPYIAVISVILLAVAIFFLLQQNSEIKRLEQSAELVDQHLEEQKAYNRRLIDSLNNSSQNEVISAQSKKIDSLITAFNNRPKNGTYDKDIDRITDVDSIAKLFAKYYPNNP